MLILEQEKIILKTTDGSEDQNVTIKHVELVTAVVSISHKEIEMKYGIRVKGIIEEDVFDLIRKNVDDALKRKADSLNYRINTVLGIRYTFAFNEAGVVFIGYGTACEVTEKTRSATGSL